MLILILGLTPKLTHAMIEGPNIWRAKVWRCVQRLVLRQHFHDWKIPINPMTIHGIGYMTRPCDRVPVECKCGEKRDASWHPERGLYFKQNVQSLPPADATEKR